MLLVSLNFPLDTIQKKKLGMDIQWKTDYIMLTCVMIERNFLNGNNQSRNVPKEFGPIQSPE